MNSAYSAGTWVQGMAQLMAMQGRGPLGNSADAALAGSSYASAGGVPHAGSTGALSDDLQFGPGTLPQGASPATCSLVHLAIARHVVVCPVVM